MSKNTLPRLTALFAAVALLAPAARRTVAAPASAPR